MLKIAHRGSHSTLPENSLSAFKHAISLGADAIELDVRLCGSGEVIVLHDPWMKRVFGASGNVRKMSLEEIQNYTFIGTNECLPTLEDVFHVLGKKIQINVEIKDINVYNHDLARRVVQLIDVYDLYKTVWISSFNPLVLDFIKTIEPKIKTGFLFNKTKYIPLLLSQFLQFDAWHPNYQLVDEAFMSVARKREKEVYAWTVNQQEDIDSLKALNINGIITDYIERL